jgi:large subunit ribosomal protein L29
MTMKIQAMLDWSPEEKAAKAKEWAQSLFTLRLQKATGQLENPMKIKELRKDLARLKTAQHMSAAETAAAAAHEVAHAEGTEETGAKISANAKSAAGAAKPKAHAPAGKGAKKRAAAHKKKAAAATGKKTGGSSAKAHAPSKKSSAVSGKAAGAPKAKSAATKKSKKK